MPEEEEEDQLLQDFESQLSPSDQKLLLVSWIYNNKSFVWKKNWIFRFIFLWYLQKMHSKVKYLQAALHEPDKGPNPGEEEAGEMHHKTSELQGSLW